VKDAEGKKVRRRGKKNIGKRVGQQTGTTDVDMLWQKIEIGK
jgi:hypothetical protein